MQELPDIRNIIKCWKELPNNHPDKLKFSLEQARIRMKDYNRESYLKNLLDTDWEQKYIKEYEDSKSHISKINLNNNNLDPVTNYI